MSKDTTATKERLIKLMKGVTLADGSYLMPMLTVEEYNVVMSALDAIPASTDRLKERIKTRIKDLEKAKGQSWRDEMWRKHELKQDKEWLHALSSSDEKAEADT